MRGHRGWMHVVYDHRWRPSQIDVVCPGCGALAQARDPHHGTNINPHDEFFDKPVFRVACTRCPFRAANLRFNELPDLYHQVGARGRVLWAWNLEHLQMLLGAMQQRDAASNKRIVAPYVEYINGDWKRHRAEFAKVIVRHMKDMTPRARYPFKRKPASSTPVLGRTQRAEVWARLCLVPPAEGGSRASIRGERFRCHFAIGMNQCDAMVHMPRADPLFAGEERNLRIELMNARRMGGWGGFRREGVVFELRESGRLAARGTILFWR